jgi:23S rRNA pseudouridine1911/1915/1917 synthase
MDLVLNAEAANSGVRLDHFLASRLPEFSRARLQSWIEEGRVRIDGLVAQKASLKLRGTERVEVQPAELKPLRAYAEEIPIEILYESSGVAAVNKPAGLVVHAGAGRSSGTLVNALLHHFGGLSSAGGELRPGIVHRIDKGTSGVLLVARTDAAHRSLAAQFATRSVEKTYLAVVQGEPRDRGSIDLPIGRDPLHRTRMAARAGHGRSAHTEYRVLERFREFTLLEVRIGTGRTHQIRVHLASQGHPIAGDTVYGAKPQPELGRPWLHAWRIAFDDPGSGQRVSVEAPLPEELVAWKRRLLSRP